MTSTPPPGPDATAPPLRVVPCVGAVVHDADRRLLVVQRAHDPDRGCWSVPGGRVEPGEDDATAVVREVREETGLDVVAGPLVGRVEVPAPGCVYTVSDLACTLVDPARSPVAGDDAADVAFVTRAQLDRLRCTPHLVETLAAWGVLPD